MPEPLRSALLPVPVAVPVPLREAWLPSPDPLPAMSALIASKTCLLGTPCANWLWKAFSVLTVSVAERFALIACSAVFTTYSDEVFCCICSRISAPTWRTSAALY